jgi:Yip1 domain
MMVAITELTDPQEQTPTPPASAGFSPSTSPLAVLYGVLFEPSQVFATLHQRLDQPTQLMPLFNTAAVLLLVVSLQLPIAMQVGQPLSRGYDDIANACIGSTLAMGLECLLVSLLVALLGYVFTAKWRLLPLLTVSALSLAPWLLLAPIRLLGTGLPKFLSPVVYFLLALGLTVWAFWLLYKGIASVFNMSASQTLVLLLLPSLLGIVSVVGLIDFFTALGRLAL